jgi:dihydroneopterin aldolase
MSDRITLSELEVFYRVGVPDAERERPQRLTLTLVMECDVGAAAAGDDLRRTVDYAAVAERLRGLGKGREWKLIETVAVDVATLVLEAFAVDRVEVEVRKFILPDTQYVSVRVARDR